MIQIGKGEKFNLLLQFKKPFVLGFELASKKINWFLYVSIMSMRMGIDQRDWVEKVKTEGVTTTEPVRPQERKGWMLLEGGPWGEMRPLKRR